MKIYVASSWRNQYQDIVVKYLKQLEHEVYDFKHPSAWNEGFHWSHINANWKDWNFSQYKEALKSDNANQGFRFDYDALNWCNVGVLVLPSGRSAHLEAGYLKGQNKKLIIYIPSPETIEPELMYKLADYITNDLHGIEQYLMHF